METRAGESRPNGPNDREERERIGWAQKMVGFDSVSYGFVVFSQEFI